MKKIFYLMASALLIISSLPRSGVAGDVFQEYEKVIWIDQVKQVGTAYDEGEKLFEFPVLSGDDLYRTKPGIYTVKRKDEHYYSRKYDTPMPFALFIDLKEMIAIHAGEVPPPGRRKTVATHGCIHVESPYIVWLYDWSDDEAHTAVVICGNRTGN